MSSSSADRDLLDVLAEDFVRRYRAGEHPSLTEYSRRLPEREAEIRDLFPALIEIEQLKPATGELTADHRPGVEAAPPAMLGDFRIISEVGKGGMGVVYEAIQESLGRHVALKVLPAHAFADPVRLERFRREAKAAAKLHHTNIVPVFGTGEADGRYYYAMQFIRGHALDAVIDEVRRLKEIPSLPADGGAVSEVAIGLMTGAFRTGADESDEIPAQPAPLRSLSGSLSGGSRHYLDAVVRLGIQVADALAYAHEQGIIHRDIKPSNLLLDLHGTAWVTDFGLAKANDTDDLTHTGDIVGTLRYMAPERFDNQGDHRADIYALGLTLYELLTHKPAFSADSKPQLMEQVIAANPAKPRSINPSIPRDLETIILKAIERDPAMRYQSAKEMAEDLKRFNEDRPIRARRASKSEQAWRWCRRNPAVASLLTSVLVVFAVGAAAASYFAVRADNEREIAEGRERETDDEKRKVIEQQGKLLTEQDRTRLLLYVSRMNLAQVALNEGRISRLIDLLEEMRPLPGERDLRGWEWHYLWRLCHRESSIHEIPEISEDANSPARGIPTVLLHASGHHASLLRQDFSGRPGVESKVWFGIVETATGKLLWRRSEMVSNPNPTQVFSTSEDGRFVAFITAVRNERRLRMFDTQLDREILLKEPNLDYFSTLEITPNGEQILACTHTLMAGLGADFPGDPAARPLCVIWDVKGGTVRRIPLAALSDSKDTPNFATPTPDGRTLIVALNRDGERNKLPRPMEAWDISGDKPKRLYKLPDDALDYAMSPGGAVLLVRTESGERRIVSAATGKVIHTFVPADQTDAKIWIERNTPTGWVSDDGNTLAIHTYSEPSRIAVTRRLGADSDQWQSSIIHLPAQQMLSLAMSKDGQRLVASGHLSAAIRTWDISSPLDYSVAWNRPKQVAPDSGGGFGSVHTMSDDHRIVVRCPMFGGPDRPERRDPENRKSTVIDGRTGRVLHRLSPPDGEPSMAVLSPDGERLLLPSFRPTEKPADGPGNGMETYWRLYETTTGRLIAESAGLVTEGHISFSPDGRYLITPAPIAPGDLTNATRLAIRDARTATVLTLTPTWPETQAGSHLFDPQGRWLVLWMFSMDARPGDRRIVCLDLANGRELWSKTEPNIGFVTFAISPDGKLLVTGQSKSDSESRQSKAVVRILDPANGNELTSVAVPPLVIDARTRDGYRGPFGIYHLAFSADGKQLVLTHGRELFVKTLGDDRPAIRLVGNEQDIAAVRLDAGGRRAFTIEMSLGFQLGKGLGIKVWDLESGRELITLSLPNSENRSSVGGGGASPQFWIENEKLRVLTPEGIREFDGTPVPDK